MPFLGSVYNGGPRLTLDRSRLEAVRKECPKTHAAASPDLESEVRQQGGGIGC
jgi:hypothetical protein